MHEKSQTARRYDREFKEGAVALVRGGRTISRVARDLGVTTWSLGRWVQLARTGGEQREPTTLVAESEEARRVAPPAPGERSSAPAARHPKKAFFAASRQTYGCPRVTAALRQRGVRCGKNRVARLMRENRLRPRQKRKRWRPTTTDSRHREPVAENWLAKVPAPDRPDRVWVADITCIDTGEGWLYLAGILDACARRLVGRQTGESLDASLVTQAWQKAVCLRRPGPGLLHHSDRGMQCASGAMAALLAAQGDAASMSRQGNCYDDATMESFWATLKAECFHGVRPATWQAAKLLTFDYVEGFYNRSRLHSGLGYQSPLAFETSLSHSKN